MILVYAFLAVVSICVAISITCAVIMVRDMCRYD